MAIHPFVSIHPLNNFPGTFRTWVWLNGTMSPVGVSHSVIPDTLWPHGLKPARFLCPWSSPGKNTGVGCHFLLQGIFPTQGVNPGLLHWQAGSLLSEPPGKSPGCCKEPSSDYFHYYRCPLDRKEIREAHSLYLAGVRLLLLLQWVMDCLVG